MKNMPGYEYNCANMGSKLMKKTQILSVISCSILGLVTMQCSSEDSETPKYTEEQPSK